MKNLLAFLSLSLLCSCVPETKFGIGVNTDFNAPAEVTGVIPADNSFINNTTVRIEGECEEGSEVIFEGADLDSDVSVSCSSGAFSTLVDFTVGYEAKDFTITQEDSAGNRGDTLQMTYELIQYYPTSISAGSEHTCVKVNDGGIRCWGANDLGQLGNNASSDSNVQVSVAFLSASSVSSMAAYDAGSQHACAVDNSGDIFCWGYQLDGRLGNGALASAGVNGAASASSVANDATKIAAGGSHTCVITSASGVICAGSNSDLQIGSSMSESAVFIDVQRSSSSLSSITEITAGFKHTCAVESGGQVLCWGDNDTGALGNGNSSDASEPSYAQASSSSIVSQIEDVEAGNGFTCALQNTSAGGGVLCWGENDSGQLGNGAASGTPSLEAQEVSGLSNIEQITVGSAHACALTEDETVVCWGDNSFGQLGVDDGSVTSSDVPLEVENLTRVTAIGAGDNHTCALTDYGSLFCWGANTKGQLGDASETDRTAPTLVNFSP